LGYQCVRPCSERRLAWQGGASGWYRWLARKLEWSHCYPALTCGEIDFSEKEAIRNGFYAECFGAVIVEFIACWPTEFRREGHAGSPSIEKLSFQAHGLMTPRCPFIHKSGSLRGEAPTICDGM